MEGLVGGVGAFWGRVNWCFGFPQTLLRTTRDRKIMRLTHLSPDLQSETKPGGEIPLEDWDSSPKPRQAGLKCLKVLIPHKASGLYRSGRPWNLGCVPFLSLSQLIPFFPV